MTGKPKIHSDFKLEATFAFVVGLIAALSSVFLFFWGAVLASILLGWTTGPGSAEIATSVVGWLVPLTSFLVAAFLMFLGRFLLINYRSRLHRASWLVQHVQPRRMVVDFPPNTEAPGRIAHLREENSSVTETVEVRSPSWKLKGLKASTVDVYHEYEPEGVVVLATANGFIWGFRKAPGSPL